MQPNRLTTPVVYYTGQFSNGDWFIAWKREYKGVRTGGFHCGGFKSQQAADRVIRMLNRG